jgi:GNAT superfamily N-acetyltransferase
MLDDIQIRTTIKPGDIGYIIYLHGILYAAEFDWDYSFETYVAEPLSEFARSNDPHQRIWIVEQSDRVCGSIALVRISSDKAQLRWFLIHPSLRGKGIGKKLMTLLMDFASQEHYQSIELWTVKGLEVACALYRRYGFELSEEKTSHIWGSTVIEQKYLLNI